MRKVTYYEMIGGFIMSVKEKEITSPVQLCLSDGTLNSDSVGWARKPIITSNVRGQFLRKKKWNYWCVYGRDALFSATISNLDYATVCFVYYLEYETKRFIEKTIILPLDFKTNMPEDVQKTVEVSHKDLHLSFIADERKTLLKISSHDFGGKYLAADITISYPEAIDSLNVVVPWSERKFQFTAKHHCLPASGYFTVGEQTFSFNPNTDYAVLDYGRGVWPRESSWNWGMASGRQNDDVIGLNLGGKWTDCTGSTENAIIENGVLYKISEDLKFEYNRNDFMQDWHVTSPSGDVNITFKPFFERIAKTDIGLIKSDVHQMVGHYYGTIKLMNGKTITLNHFLGCIEDHYAKW